jgi:SAM-dependent methyltransferase
MAAGGSAWERQARAWQRHTSPLRPHPDDIAVVERVAAALARERGSIDAVILGVTPEIAGSAWPPATRLKAFDSSAVMIERLWPAPGTPATASAEPGDWAALPLDDASVDLVAADNSLAVQQWPDGAERVVREVRRILRPGGRFVVRTLLRPAEPEPITAILDDLEAGRIALSSVAKVRAAAIVHRPGTAGFRIQDLKDLWLELFPDPETAARRFGWSTDSFVMPEVYDPEVTMIYPTANQLDELVSRWFREAERAFGSYQLAERSPTLVLEPR